MWRIRKKYLENCVKSRSKYKSIQIGQFTYEISCPPILKMFREERVYSFNFEYLENQ